MGQTVQEFIQAAQAKEREEYEYKRNLHLLELGLIDSEKITKYYSKSQSSVYTMWDSEKQMWYYSTPAPLDVTDEEYEEIKRLSEKKEEPLVLNNGAESFLNVMLIISLIIGIIGTLALFVIGMTQYIGGGVYIISAVALLIASLVNFSVGKVALNISKNLHTINAKIKNTKE